MSQAVLKWENAQFDVTPFLKDPLSQPSPVYVTAHGALYNVDCMRMLPVLKNEVADTVFADPPFNLGKQYGEHTRDNLPDGHYIEWCRQWPGTLRPGA